MTEIESVLDLPLNQQKELAALEGLSHEEWVCVTKEEFEQSKEFLHKIKNDELKDSGMTPEEIRQFQERMNSQAP